MGAGFPPLEPGMRVARRARSSARVRSWSAAEGGRVVRGHQGPCHPSLSRAHGADPLLGGAVGARVHSCRRRDGSLIAGLKTGLLSVRPEDR